MRQANVEKKTAFLHKENGSTIQVRNNERCSLLCNSYFPTLVLSRSGPKGIFSVPRVKSERTPTKIIDDADLASSFLYNSQIAFILSLDLLQYFQFDFNVTTIIRESQEKNSMSRYSFLYLWRQSIYLGNQKPPSTRKQAPVI